MECERLDVASQPLGVLDCCVVRCNAMSRGGSGCWWLSTAGLAADAAAVVSLRRRLKTAPHRCGSAVAMQRSAGGRCNALLGWSLSLSLSLSVSLSHSLTQAASHLHIPALCHCRQGRRRGQAAANGRTDGLTAVSGRSETAACKTAVTDGDSTEEAADGRQNATEGRRETEGGPSSDKRCTAMAVGRSERLEAAVDGAVTSGE